MRVGGSRERRLRSSRGDVLVLASFVRDFDDDALVCRKVATIQESCPAADPVVNPVLD